LIQESKKSFFMRLMFVLNMLAVIFLLLSYLAAYVSPVGSLWWLQLVALTYGFLLLLNLSFLLFWILAKRKTWWYSAVAILIGFSRIFGIAELGFASSTEPERSAAGKFPVKVMSFNVRLFDLYNWFRNNETRGKIFDFLKNESPDIACFQEYYSSDRKLADFNNNKAVPKILSAPYSHIEYTVTARDSDHWGIAIFSKHPIVKKQAVHFEKRGGNIFIYADVRIGNDTIRVFNTHLESIRFRNEDYRYVENLRNDVEQDEMAGGLKILQRLQRAYARRAAQVDVLKKEIESSPYSVIVCGDFNDTPSSYSYHKISEGLKDAFRESGTGFGKTYAGLFPSFRIDYMLHSEKLFSTHYRTHREKVSDHFAITCWMGFDED
jgi:endonuclease/exonuclease/phosphatase family metal-dependent hydrolase